MKKSVYDADSTVLFPLSSTAQPTAVEFLCAQFELGIGESSLHQQKRTELYKSMFTSKQIAAQLVALDIRATAKGESDDMVDGEIELPGGYHVQVGSNYLCLVYEEGETFHFQPEQTTVLGLLTDIAKVELLTTDKLKAYLAQVEASPSN